MPSDSKKTKTEYETIPTPSTRFQGSKKRAVSWIVDTAEKQFPKTKTVLDAFSGTGIVSYAFARHGKKKIIAVDQLRSSAISVEAFIGNKVKISDSINTILREISNTPLRNNPDKGFLVNNYKGIFYPDDELRWLEKASFYAAAQMDKDTRSAFLWCLFQASLAKRPYNLFHRANLSMRTKEVKRSFGNKTTWDKTFPEHIKKFAAEQSKFVLPDATRPKTKVADILKLKAQPADLIYIDPPYTNKKGLTTDYLDFYGFLELICDSSLILEIDKNKPHKPLKPPFRSAWTTRSKVASGFEDLFEKYSDRNLLVSYRADGEPSIKELEEMLESQGFKTETKKMPIQYALSKSKVKEALIVAHPA